MKKKLIALTLIGYPLLSIAQAPVAQTAPAVQAPKAPVVQKTQAVAPSVQKQAPQPQAAQQNQPPAEFIELMQKNAEKLDALFKQVKAGSDKEAQKIVTEIEAIHEKFKDFEKRQKAAIEQPQAQQPAKSKARKIQ